MIYIGSSLSEARLVPKIVEQLMLPPGVSLEKRIVVFIARMPSLQKLGQTIARNRNLDQDFRRELVKLENMIHDVTPEQIRTQIISKLGTRMESYRVRLESELHAEASVSAVMGFSWMNPERGRREEGVFKVLKPYIRDFMTEELDLMKGLADYLEHPGEDYFLSGADFKGILDDVRDLMEREIDSVNEQSNLSAASHRYQDMSGIRIPRFITELSSPGITAMSMEKGIKVTDVCTGNTARRNRLAARIIEALVAVPLFSREDESVFHADPHAGNLYVNEETIDLVIYDWAMTDSLSLNERRLLVLLMAFVMLRDETMIYQTVIRLKVSNLTDATDRRVKKLIRQFVSEISPFSWPGFEQVLSLLDDLVLTGINFSSPLLIFRKVLMTMSGLLHDMNVKLPLEEVLAGYFLDRCMGNLWFMEKSLMVKNPLSDFDMFSLCWSTQWLGTRIGMQTWKRWLNINC